MQRLLINLGSFCLPLFIFLAGFLKNRETALSSARPTLVSVCVFFPCENFPSKMFCHLAVNRRTLAWFCCVHETRCPDKQGGRGPNGEQRVTFLPPGGALADFCNVRRPRRKWEPGQPLLPPPATLSQHLAGRTHNPLRLDFKWADSGYF